MTERERRLKAKSSLFAFWKLYLVYKPGYNGTLTQKVLRYSQKGNQEMNNTEYEEMLKQAFDYEDKGGGLGCVNAVWPTLIVWKGKRIQSHNTPSHIAQSLKGSDIKEGDIFDVLSNKAGNDKWVWHNGHPEIYHAPLTKIQQARQDLMDKLLSEHYDLVATKRGYKNKAQKEYETLVDIGMRDWDRLYRFAPVYPLAQRARLDWLMHRASPYRAQIEKEILRGAR